MTLALSGLTKRLGSFELPPLDLEVAEGEYFVLLGPSGVGKTVLLEIIAGLLRPSAGRISWRGRDVTYLAPEQRGCSIVYQDYALFPHMSVRHNIAYGLRSRGVSRTSADEKVAVAAGQIGIAALLDRVPDSLSGGEQQRVALARALVTSPMLVLLDEPLSAVDLRMRRELRAELKKLHCETGATFMHVTHDVDEALQLGQRIAVMLDGRIRQVGTAESLFQRPSDAAVADFLGIRNILPVTARAGDTCEVDGLRIHVGERKEQYGHIWIRPEEILLSAEPFTSSARNQLRCRVADWEFRDVLVAVKVASGDLLLTVLITYASFEELRLAKDGAVYATFKSSAVHSF